MAAARRAKQKTADEVNFDGRFRIESELILDFLILEDTYLKFFECAAQRYNGKDQLK